MKNKYFLFPLLIIFQINSQTKKNDSTSVRNIEEVTLSKRKKSVERLADRMIYDFSEQPSLNSGNLLEGLKKIPGLVASEFTDVIYQGSSMAVYLNGKPLNLSGDQLIAYLEGLPANSIEKIELITNPGSEYSATSGSAILNIVTSRKRKDYLSLIYSGGYSFSNYEKHRNRFNNSVLVASKVKWINWQMSLGQSYKENYFSYDIKDLIQLKTDNAAGFYFLRPNVTFNLPKSKITLDYDFSFLNNNIENLQNGYSSPWRKDGYTQNLEVSYQKEHDDRDKNFSIRYFYSDGYEHRFSKRLIEGRERDENDHNVFSHSVKTDFGRPINFLDFSKVSIGAQYDYGAMLSSGRIGNFKHEKNTTASYVQISSKFKKWNPILGIRGEYYRMNSILNEKEVSSYDSFQLFPNARLQYNLMNSVFFAAGYNRKIKLPTISTLDPNAGGIESGSISFSGSPGAKPTIYNNIDFKFSFFDYATIFYENKYAKNESLTVIEKNEPNNVIHTYRNVPDFRVENYGITFPVPFMIFTKGFREFMKFNFDINKINFLYFGLIYQKHSGTGISNPKGFYTFQASGRFILPYETALEVIYRTISKGNYQYFYLEESYEKHGLDVNISKKFMKNNLSLSLYGNDLLNSRKNVFRSIAENDIVSYQKNDTRSFGLSLIYKINANKGIDMKKIENLENSPQEVADPI